MTFANQAVFPITADSNDRDHLTLGGIDVLDLVAPRVERAQGDHRPSRMLGRPARVPVVAFEGLELRADPAPVADDLSADLDLRPAAGELLGLLLGAVEGQGPGVHGDGLRQR